MQRLAAAWRYDTHGLKGIGSNRVFARGTWFESNGSRKTRLCPASLVSRELQSEPAESHSG